VTFPIRRCACGTITGNPEYKPPAGLPDPHGWRTRKYFQAVLLKLPLPPIDDLVEAWVCDKCKHAASTPTPA
jgi:hypothetical protein